MNYRKPQYLTKQGFTRSGRRGSRPVKGLSNPQGVSSQNTKVGKKGLSEEAARHIASVIKKMLKSP
jgi:hypothetical protein